MVLLSPGVYRVRAPLAFRGDGCELIGIGRPVLQADELLPRIVDSDGRSRLRIAGVCVQGAGVQATGGRGAIHLDEGSRGCTVENSEVRDAPGTGIVDDGDGNAVRGNLVAGTGEHGIYVSGCRGGWYTGNRVTQAGTVAGATLVAHGISVADAAGCTIRDNVVDGGAGLGVVLRDGAHDNALRGNLVRGTRDRLLLIGSGSDNLLEGNTLEDDPAGRDSLQITGGGGNRIEGNYIHRTSPGGAAIRWVGDEVLGGDIVRGNVVLLDGLANYYAFELDAPRAGPVHIAGNTIQAIRGARMPAAIHAPAPERQDIGDNLVLGPRDARALGPGAHLAGTADALLRCDASRGQVTVVLPPAAAVRWRVYAVEQAGAAAHPVVLRGTDEERIDGARELLLPSGGARRYLQSTGRGWQVLP